VQKGDLDFIVFMGEQGEPCLAPRTTDKGGRSALDIARDMGRRDIVKELTEQVATHEWWEKNRKKR